ncbi:PREDICTED: S-methyl-5'-thioadenosine phosphorylase-like isoform X2 [Papilio xuthus]|uniref:S-methyl-5'-thioadenosine phosphorylase n=1 Tax=Papilio xuthus TaxID=66420 RepID=A0AAJ7E9Z2_PAPXU|nr:PREDICTED: S-methyl-5'-thioadenosine phosphorylase-like isoform X2 [Papilio xuthus]
MAYDLQKEEDVKQYIENLGIEYRFGCYHEKKSEVCHLLADYLEAIKKDYKKAATVYKTNCMDYKYGKSCTKYGNYALIGRGKDKPDSKEALEYFEKGCEFNDPTSCLHAGVLLTATGPGVTVQRDVPKGYNYLKKSCDARDDMACHYLSGMYLTGVPKNVADFNPHNPEKNKNIDYLIKPDLKQAFDLAMKGCEYGNIFACANIGIIGGSGFDDPNLFENPVELDLSTPFGKPSDVLLSGQIDGVPCVLLARHGRKHQYQPSDVNYRANIWALKQAGCTHVLATTATGSLVEDYQPGDLVILDDFIDRTWGRKCTFYDRTEGGPRGVCHLPMHPAFCERSRRALQDAARLRGYKYHENGTAVVIQGPRFSSRAESLMHRQWGGHLVNMTTVPEVNLAKEAGLSYAAVALVTDYDCWRKDEKSVSVSEVLAMFAKNVKKAADVILDAVQILAADTDLEYLDAHENMVSSAIMLKE